MQEYKGRLAETLAEVFFKKCGYFVTKYGVENSVNFQCVVSDKNAIDESKKDIMSKIMTSPDFTIMELDENRKIKDVYLIEVKYRTFDTEYNFEKSLKKDGNIYKWAKKYNNLWDSNVLIFLIAKIDKTIITYCDSVDEIINTNKMDKLEDNTIAKKCKNIKIHKDLVQKVFENIK